MSNIANFPPRPDGPATDPQSEAIADVIRKLLGVLPVAERERILREVASTLPPTPTPRAGEVLDVVVRYFRTHEQGTVKQIKEEVSAAGVEASPKEIYNSVGYLTRKGHIRRIGYGRYIVDGMLLITSEDLGGEPAWNED